MKTRQISIVVTSSLFTLFLIVSQHASADSCSARLTSYDAPQFYLLADGVFSGTVQHIDNTTDHQWNVYFTVDKLWKGSPSVKPLMIMTNTLQGCGYSIIQGEKYLAYTNGYPPFFNTVWSKPYADAQSDIAIIDDPKFQSDEKAQMELNKKLEIAKEAISNLMGSKMGSIPFNSVGVDEINSTLDVGIDSTKATFSEEQYLEKIKEIVGDIPIKITFGQNVADMETITTHPIQYETNSTSMQSPLEQFKSGIDAADVKCKSNFLLVIKSKNSHPACTTPLTALHLLNIGWGHITSPFDTNVDLLNSKISGGAITGYHYDFQSKSLVIKTQTTSDGNTTVTIPRKLLDARTGNQDDKFYVLVNGQETDFRETSTTDVDRTLFIPFKQDTTLIEIIGDQIV